MYTVAVADDNRTVYRVNSQEQVIRGGLSLMKYLDDNMDESILQDLYDSGKLMNITFTLRHEDPNVVLEPNFITTDRYGYAETAKNALVYGTWYITESNTPKGYKGIKDAKIKVTENGIELKYVVSNDTWHIPIKIQKKDLQTGNIIPLSGAKFQVLDADGIPITMPNNLNVGKLTDTFTTDEDGEIVLANDLKAGVYTLKEVAAPAGYDISIDPFTFEVEEKDYEDNELVVEYYDSPQVGKINITKEDQGGNRLGSGFTFEIRTLEDITDASGEIRKMEINGEETELKANTIVAEVTTDETGIAASPELYLGKYTVRETEADEYYAINQNEYEVALNPDPDVQTIEVDLNISDQKTSFDLYKIDSQAEELALGGITFRIFSTADAGGPEKLMEAVAKFRSGEGKTAFDVYGSEYTTDENGRIHVEDLLHDTTYYVYETSTLPGYNLDPSIYEFYVDQDGLIDGDASYILKISNVANLVEISKKDITGGEELPGATLTVTGEDGSLVETWVSGEEPHYIKGLAAGTYTLTEDQAPIGYAIAESITFTLTDSLEIQQVTMYDDLLQVSVSKKSVTGDEELPGAHLTITDANGEVIEAWVSGDEPHMINLPVGKYTLTEIAAPEKYATAESIDFEVLADMSVTKVEMRDAPILVEISKKDITSGDELPGAKLQILDKEGIVVEEWTSAKEPHMVSLSTGTYTLHEDAAPAGYAVASSIVFEVKDTAEVQKVEMYDQLIAVEISKKDITNGEELPGAELTIRDADGNVVETWTSTTEPHMINLEVGKYTLTEIAAPEKYSKAETIEFEITDSMEVQKVTMFDKPIEVEISKKDITNDGELPGAKLIIRDKDRNTVEEWISTDQPHKVNLSAGSYTLTEITAPDGYDVAETIEFTVTDSMEVQHVTMYDSPKEKKVNLTGKEDTKTHTSSTPSGTSTYGGPGSVTSAPVKTGDYNRYLPALVIILVGMSGLAVIFIRRRSKMKQR